MLFKSCIYCNTKTDFLVVGQITHNNIFFSVRCKNVFCGSAFYGSTGFDCIKKFPREGSIKEIQSRLIYNFAKAKKWMIDKKKEGIELTEEWKNNVKKKSRGLSCPHCLSRLLIRSTENIDPFQVAYYLQCDSFLCNAGFLAILDLSESLKDMRRVDLNKLSKVIPEKNPSSGRSISKGLLCSCCGSAMHTRSSEKLSPLLTRFFLQCGSKACSKKIASNLEFVAMLFPGFKPDSHIYSQLPILEQRPRNSSDPYDLKPITVDVMEALYP